VSQRILVVDDEPNIVDLIATALRFQGYEAESAATGQEAIREVAAYRPHLMVLDVMLPDMDGFEVAERLAARHDAVPILFLTARDATQDKVRGLTVGGDDYVTKPFSLEELVARIRTILRRTGHSDRDSGRLEFDDLELDEDTREVTRGGHLIELTATEYRLLHYFMLNPRVVLTRLQLLEHVWD
jgi:two-component system OmpR family response regulator